MGQGTKRNTLSRFLDSSTPMWRFSPPGTSDSILLPLGASLPLAELDQVIHLEYLVNKRIPLPLQPTCDEAEDLK
jgi:hypothetical protein